MAIYVCMSDVMEEADFDLCVFVHVPSFRYMHLVSSHLHESGISLTPNNALMIKCNGSIAHGPAA